MTNGLLITKTWAYNICMLGDEPHLLLAKRIGYETAFWHLPCGGLTTPAGNIPSDAAVLHAAVEGNVREAGLPLKAGADASLLMMDETKDSDWGGARVGHVLIDHGKTDQLPECEPRSVATPAGLRGVSSLAWVKLNSIVVRSQPDTAADPAASPHVFFQQLPLRSMVAKTAIVYILRYLNAKYGPFRSALARAGSLVTGIPERFPHP